MNKSEYTDDNNDRITSEYISVHFQGQLSRESVCKV